MEKNNKSSPEKISGGLQKKHEDINLDKRNPNPDDPNEETESPIKEMPTTSNPHPHHEEIMDRTPI